MKLPGRLQFTFFLSTVAFVALLFLWSSVFIGGMNGYYGFAIAAESLGDRGVTTEFNNQRAVKVGNIITIVLTKEEKAWLKEHPVIKVVNDPGWPPIEFSNSEGIHSGITSDYKKIIEQRLGITFENVRNLDWQEAYKRLKRWEIDMTFSVAVTPERETFWAFTKPYMKTPIVIVTQNDVTYISHMKELNGKTVAVVDGYAVNDWIPRDFPQIRLIRVKTATDGIDAVQKGKAFAYIDNMLVVGYYIAKLKAVNVKIAGETPYVNAQCMAVRKDWPILAGILNKALNSISEEKRALIYQKWVPIRYEHGFNYSLFWQVVAIAVVIFIAILLWLVVWNRKLYSEIAHRKKAEAALEDQAVRMHILVDQSQDGIVILNQDGSVYESNQRFAEMLGYSLEEVSHLCVWNWEFSYPKEQVQEMLKTVGRGGDSFETVHRRKDGSTYYVDIRTNAADFAGQKLIFCVCRDISDRKKAEEVHEMLMAAIEQTDDIVIITDRRGVIQFVNAAFYTSTGWKQQDILLRNPGVLSTSHYDKALYRSLWRTILRGNTWKGRMVIDHKDGTFLNLAVSVSPVHDSSGKIVNYVAVARDVTEQIQLQERLEQAQRMESVGRLAGGVAHDYNNVLSVILGYTELALEKLDKSSTLYADLLEVQKAGQRSADITRQLLAFARKQTIVPKVLDLNATIEGMLKMLHRLIGEDVELKWLPKSMLWKVKMDPSQIDQILANLCVNARDAIEDTGKIVIETANITTDDLYCADHPDCSLGDYVLIAFSDDGCGMSKEVLENLFEPFFTTKGVGEGTGLGLATIYGIIKQNDGFINVYSEPGKGTTFRVYLPRYVEEVINVKEEEKAKAPSGIGETILVVEDDGAILALAEKFLLGLGYKVLTAQSPEEAIKLSNHYSGKVHLLITDVVLPKMNGKDLAHRILVQRPSTKCLFMSGYTANVIAHRGVLDEGVRFIQKPFSLNDLASKVRGALEEI
jgi:PAS domain S-box-containing protein